MTPLSRPSGAVMPWREMRKPRARLIEGAEDRNDGDQRPGPAGIAAGAGAKIGVALQQDVRCGGESVPGGLEGRERLVSLVDEGQTQRTRGVAVLASKGHEAARGCQEGRGRALGRRERTADLFRRRGADDVEQLGEADGEAFQFAGGVGKALGGRRRGHLQLDEPHGGEHAIGAGRGGAAGAGITDHLQVLLHRGQAERAMSATSARAAVRVPMTRRIFGKIRRRANIETVLEKQDVPFIGGIGLRVDCRSPQSCTFLYTHNCVVDPMRPIFSSPAQDRRKGPARSARCHPCRGDEVGDADRTGPERQPGPFAASFSPAGLHHRHVQRSRGRASAGWQ